jgi:two-component system response regulator
MILVVEDSSEDEALMNRAFEGSNVGPVTFRRDGADALAYLLGNGGAPGPLPDLVLLDMNLPRIKGLEVLRRIRAAERTRLVPVVVFTSSAKTDDVARSYELGANSFIGKPRDPDRFADAIRSIARYWIELNQMADEPWRER